MTSTQRNVSVQADDTPDRDDRGEVTEVRPTFVTLTSDDAVGVCTVDGECS